MFNRINKNKSKISILLALLLMLSPVCQQHVYAYDEVSADTVISSEIEEADVVVVEEISEIEEAENTEIEVISENEEAESTQADEVAEGEVVNENTLGGAVSNIHPAAQDIPHSNVSESYEGTVQDRYEVTIRGVDESIVNGVYTIIDKYIDEVIQTGKRLVITNNTPGNLIDAEKYSTDVTGYDAQHCWAATASNILWTTGYAKQAVNPLTGQNFTNEDEVMAYFSENFTDDAGDPEEAVNWFIKGTYGFDNDEHTAHRKSTESGKLLPELSSDVVHKIINVEDNPSEGVNALRNVAAYGMGVLVRWLDNGQLSAGAHWMTISGVVEDVVNETISGLILANSDDTPVYEEGPDDLNATSWSEKQNAKRQQTNAYVVHRVSKLDDYWVIDGFSNKPTVITMLYYLLDSDKTPQGDCDDTKPDSSRVINSTMDKMKDYVNTNTDSIKCSTSDNAETSTDNKDVIGGEVTVEVAVSESDLISMIESFMTANKLTILPATDVISDINADYEVYLLNADNIKSITINGKELTKDQYSIVTLKNGLKKIVIKNSFLKTLKKGSYKLSINVNDGKTLDTVFNIVY